MSKRYLTKSLFKMALECPTKLFYAKKKNEYANKKIDDPYLAALAQGGFQVGALSQCYYPEGALISTLDKEEAILQTNKLLEQENVVIFEPAIVYNNLLIRVDILIKEGNTYEVIEVKSKSTDSNTFYDDIWNKTKLKKGVYQLKSDWISYIYDAAFQDYVVRNAFKTSNVKTSLMLADKSKVTTIDGLNSKFLLKKNTNGEPVTLIGDVSKLALGDEILCKLDISEIIDKIYKGEEVSVLAPKEDFKEFISYFADHYEKDIRIVPDVGSHCKNCEFRCTEDGLKNGFSECWNLSHGMSEDELHSPFVFDIWNFRGSTKLIKDGVHLVSDMNEESVNVKCRSDSKGGLSRSERQLLQIEKIKNKDPKEWIDLTTLSAELKSHKFPLHMIDFETSRVAIPFYKNQRPYYQLAFQFSHHVMFEDGTVEHKSEFIEASPGVFPNFMFVRALKKSLGESGTIFRYSNHENTVLCDILGQLEQSDESDKEELISWIKTITIKKSKNDILWSGERCMIDLCEIIQRLYYNPSTNGSNSIKYVLPAVLNASTFLKDKYSKPIYGNEISSLNFTNKSWIKLHDGIVVDPYQQLEPIFSKWDRDKLDIMFSDDQLANGGAAMTAYAMMQFSEMSNDEREKLQAGLLRYCELDTLAMVMIYEYFLSITNNRP